MQIERYIGADRQLRLLTKTQKHATTYRQKDKRNDTNRQVSMLLQTDR